MLLLLLLQAPVVPADAAPLLPPIDLVRGLRAAKIAHTEGDHDREFETLRQARDTYPEDISLIYALLVFHRDHQATEDQQESLRQALRSELQDPENRPPISMLGLIVHDTLADAATLEEAAAHLERRLAGSEAEDPATLKLLVSIYSQLENDDFYIGGVERLIAVEPTDLLRWQLIYRYRIATRHEEAVELISAWLAEENAPSILRVSLIQSLSRLGRFDDVVKQVDLLLAEQQKKRSELIKSTYDIVGVETGPMGHGVIMEAAWNLRDAGKDEEAERLFRRVIEYNPESTGAQEALLYLYGSEEDLRAHRLEREAELQAEEDPYALFNEGTERLTAGDAAGAYGLLERAAPGLPQLEAVWYNLGMAAYQTENWQTVVDAFKRSGELNPQRVQAFFYRGIALEKLGQCQEAVEALEAALALDASKTLAHYYLSTCYQWLGEMDKSKKHRALYDASR